MHNSDDSMTSESEGGGRGSPTGSDEEHQETSSSSPETDDEDVGSEEEEEGEDVGKEQDMSFADRVATENRRSRPAQAAPSDPRPIPQGAHGDDGASRRTQAKDGGKKRKR